MIFKNSPWGIQNLFQGVRLLSLPQILCVSFKRFRASRDRTRKLHCRVTFPESFDFAEVAKDAFSSSFTQVGLCGALASVSVIPKGFIFSLQSDCRYTLFAVVVHSGLATGGHYTAFVRHPPDQRWYHANDSHVKRVKPYLTCREDGKVKKRAFYSNLWSLDLRRAGFLGGREVSVRRLWQVRAESRASGQHHPCDLPSKGCSRPPEGH